MVYPSHTNLRESTNLTEYMRCGAPISQESAVEHTLHEVQHTHFIRIGGRAHTHFTMIRERERERERERQRDAPIHYTKYGIPISQESERERRISIL